jgi:hypothetical protein
MLALTRQTVAICYWIYRGGAGIPDVLPVVDAYELKGSQWTYVGTSGSSFRGSTFVVHILNPKGQTPWILVSGFHIGDTATRLRLEVLAIDGNGIRSIWSQGGMARTTVQNVTASSVTLSQYTGFKDGKDQYKEILLLVGPNGLREINASSGQ